jgi:hypothetical protein
MNKRNEGMKGKHPKQSVITSRDPLECEIFYQATDSDAPLGPLQLAAGYIQHPDTGFWQVWISTNGLDITSLAAFKQPGKAASAIEILKEEGRKGGLSDPALVTALFKFLEQESDGQVRPLPNELVRKLVRDVVHYVIWPQGEREVTS